MVINKLTPNMIARVALRQIYSIVGDLKHSDGFIFGGISGNERFAGITVNIRSYRNDNNFYFDFNINHINFTITLPMFDKIWELSLDDFAENILQLKIMEKLDYYGFASWD